MDTRLGEGFKFPESVLQAQSPRPWLRFWARQIDYLLFGASLWAIAALWLGSEIEHFLQLEGFLTNLLGTFLWIFVEAFLISKWGQTPGKWIFGITVKKRDGLSLSGSEALTRAFRVWLRGVGLGIPIISVFTMALAYNHLNKAGHSTWDESGHSLILHSHVTARRVLTGAASVVAAYIAYGIVGLAGMPESERLQEFRQQAVAEVDALEHELSNWLADYDGSLTPLVDHVVGALDSEQMEEFPFSKDKSLRVFVLAGCDEDCSDLDLGVKNAAGEYLVTDTETDASPVVYFEAKAGEPYNLVVNMVTCASEPCSFALRPFAADTADLVLGGGTCFSVSEDGLVVTANHVVDGGGSVWVNFSNGSRVRGELVAASEDHDLVLLKTNAATPDFLSFGDTVDLELGSWVFTIGYPATGILGEAPKFTDGTISALSGIQDDAGFLQMSVPIQPGNSGGPLIDDKGQVVGIIKATAETGSFERVTGSLPQSVNWAVKAEFAADLLGRASPIRPPAPSRHDAIERAEHAVCRIEVTG